LTDQSVSWLLLFLTFFGALASDCENGVNMAFPFFGQDVNEDM
jgi:hypothetical protein